MVSHSVTTTAKDKNFTAMKLKSFLPLALVGLFASTFGQAAAQSSYFDDDIYYDASKSTKKAPKKTVNQIFTTPSTVIVAEYPAADTYTVNGTRTISVDDYNRRGIFATDSLTADSTTTDFAYTRRIEQFYNPEIVSGSNDAELANIYYMEPEQVNVYINTPSGYWGYDYFYPDFAYYSPYWNYNWRWGSSWYWNSWYNPYWAWGPSWGWGPGWGPAWGWGGPSWSSPGWNSRPYNPRHQGARPGSIASRPGGTGSPRPGLSGSSATTPSQRYPGSNINMQRPGVSSVSGGSVNANRNSSVNSHRNSSVNSNRTQQSAQPSRNYNTNSYNYNTNGGRTSNYNSGSFNSGSSRSGGSFGGGGYSGGGRSSSGGRGRH